MDLEKLRLTIEAQTAQAEKGIETINDLLKKQRQELNTVKEAAAASADETVRSFSKWSSAYYRALGLVKQFGDAVKTAYSAAAEGAQIQAAESFFKNAGRSIEDLRVATGGMISDAELMRKANLADSMGISMDTFKSLAKVAQASSVKTGQSFDHMFESITLGTARSSRLLLDNLGIIISVAKANENYAKKQLELAGDTNVTNKEIQAFVKNMDDAAKKVAFAEEVQKQAIGTLQEYAGANVSGAESFARFEAALSNMTESLKKLAAEALGPIIPTLTSLVDGFRALFELGPKGAVFGEAIWTIGRAVAYIASAGKLDVGESAAMTAAKTDKEYNRNQLRKTGFVVKGEIEAQIAKSTDALTKMEGALDRAFGLSAIDSVIKKFLDLGTTGDKVLDRLVAGFLDINKQTGSFFGEWKKTVTAEATPPKPPPDDKGREKKPFTKISETMLNEKYAHDWLAVVKEVNKDLLEQTAKLREKITENTKDLGGIGTALPSQSKALTVLDTKLSDAGIDAADNLEKMAKAAYEADIAFRDWAKSAAGDVTTGLATGTGAFGPLLSSFAGMAGDAISGLLSTALGAAGGGAVGAIVAALLPVIGSLLDELKPVADLLTGVVAGVAAFVKFGLGELLAGLGDLARPIQLLLTALGMAVGAILRPLANLLTPIIQGIAFVVQLLAAGITAIMFVFDIIGFVINALGTLGAALITLFLPMDTIIKNLSNAVETAAYSMIYGAVDFNNAIVKMVRSWGLKGFGRLMGYEDFIQLAEEEEKNTKAVEENTRAVRDLAREFRNMPAGYKVARTVYDAADASMQPQQSVVMTMSETAASAVSRRWRT